MSWTDKKSVLDIINIARQNNIQDLVETGAFYGINAEVQSANFRKVYTCEINPTYFAEANIRLSKYSNVEITNEDSQAFLKRFKGKYLFYLDAHFYNPEGPRWVVQDELRAIGRNTECAIVIHDFDNSLGHCIYDGERLGMNVVGDLLKKINPNFYYYTNRLEDCDIMKPEETDDEVKKDNLKYAWQTPRLTYRGLLYCSPTKLDTKLREWNSLYKIC